MSDEATGTQEPQKKEHPTAKRIRYIRDQITPSWEEITKLAVDTGMEEEGRKTSGFRKFRKKEMKRRLEIQIEGEIDSLTRLPTRKGVLRRIDEEKARMVRDAHPEPVDWKNFKYDVLFLDLNELKQINDLSHDKHSSGDEVLKKLANKLSSGIRPGDFIGRWGGDEFILFLHRDEPDASRIFWERESQLLHQEGIWICAGLAKADPLNIEESIKLADRAMYLAKQTTKNNAKKTGNKLNMMRTEKDLVVGLGK